MKTIINNLTKKIILPLAVAGLFSFNSCGNKKEFTGKVIGINKNYKEAGWDIYYLANDKDTIIAGDITKSDLPINEGDIVTLEYKYIEGKYESWEQKENRGELKQEEYNMNRLLSYDIISKTPKELKKEFSELEKYNQENKQVYSDFVEFITEKGKKDNETGTIFYFNNENTKYANLNKEGIFVIKNEEDYEVRFNDSGMDGMNGLDIYRGKEKIKKFVEDLSKEEQLEVAKEYTESLKREMHDEKYMEY